MHETLGSLQRHPDWFNPDFRNMILAIVIEILVMLMQSISFQYNVCHSVVGSASFSFDSPSGPQQSMRAIPFRCFNQTFFIGVLHDVAELFPEFAGIE